MKYAEKIYRKLRMVQVDFITNLNRLDKIWSLWKLVMKYRKGGKVNLGHIKRMAKS